MSWNNGVRYMSFYMLMNLWYGRIASWDIRVLVVFAPNLASVTDMQHHYHARYPTDDWGLAYIFSFVYFSVKVCLEGVFPHSVSTRRDPWVRVCAPLTPASPSQKKTKSNRGWPGSPLEPSEGAFELTHGSVCIIGWQSVSLDSLISTYIAQFIGCVIGSIHYSLKVIICFKHLTGSHYHHYARLYAGTEYI